MRPLILASLAFGAVACSSDSMHLEYRSTLWNETRGVVYSGDGWSGHAAMLDTTCQFDTWSGFVTGDVDLPTDAEVVSEGRGGMVLARTAEGIHTIRDLTWSPDQDVLMEGVVDAAFGATGPIALVENGGDCNVVWSGTDTTVAVPGACAGDLLSSPAEDRAFLVANGILSEVRSTGLVDLAPADHAVMGADLETVFISDGDTVSLLSLDGALRWQESLGDVVVSLDDMGSLGGVAVVTEDARITLMDGDGGTRASGTLPETADVVVSDSGRDLSLVLGDQVNFYGVEDGPQRLSVEPPENPFSD